MTCDANRVAIADLAPTNELVGLRARYRAFMEEHVYPNEPVLDREDEAADLLVAELRERAGHLTADAAAAAGDDRGLAAEIEQFLHAHGPAMLIAWRCRNS